MSKAKYIINGFEFSSKDEVGQYVRDNILNKYPSNQQISKEHFEFMLALLNGHKKREEKIGVGVKNIWIQPNEFYRTRCFWLERLDGSKTDFSYLQCLTEKKDDKKVKEAARKAVEYFTKEFKRDFFNICENRTCAILNIPITRENSHVDHIPPNTFDNIFNEFVRENNIDIFDVKLLGKGVNADGKIGNWFNDKELENKWIEFHNKRAVLRVISGTANLSDVKIEGNNTKKIF